MRRYTENERQRMVRSFEGSGESAAAFCRRHGISTVSLANWRRRGEGRRALRPAAAGTWLPVVLGGGSEVPTAAARDPYVVVAAGWRLEVPAGFVPGEVRELVQLLAGAGSHPGPLRES